jgi:hypothetical protein
MTALHINDELRDNRTEVARWRVADPVVRDGYVKLFDRTLHREEQTACLAGRLLWWSRCGEPSGRAVAGHPHSIARVFTVPMATSFHGSGLRDAARRLGQDRIGKVDGSAEHAPADRSFERSRRGLGAGGTGWSSPDAGQAGPA